MNEGKSVRSRRVGSARGVCGVARLGRGINHGRRRAPCIRSLAEPTRLTRNTQTGSYGFNILFVTMTVINAVMRDIKTVMVTPMMPSLCSRYHRSIRPRRV